MSRLPTRILLQILLRSLTLQASWNFERLQSLGALYVLAPALKLFYQGEERVSAFRRQLAYFNTHPFLAPAVLGTTLEIEKRRSCGESEQVVGEDFRRMILAPFAAMGDALFWGGIRPLAAVMALYFAARQSFWAPPVFLLLFNVPHLWFRCAGLIKGYRSGVGIVAEVQRLRLPDLAIRVKEATVVLLGGLCAYLVCTQLEQSGDSLLWAMAVLPIIPILGVLSRRGISTLFLVLSLTALVALAVGLLLPAIQTR